MNTKQRKWIRAGVMVLALVFIVIGVTRGEAATLFIKAVNICMECIGIG
ncbi:MAG: CD1871A family CXXC motif-containing protein [Lachnospiraceae bacterium]|nr:CD1871A family CXXC motif-containing protein [Lachnospiraceae bacterium]